MDSILGEEYFDRDLATGILTEAIVKGEVHVARSPEGEVLGFFRLVLDGVFLVFAYVHLLAVKKGKRGQGLGRMLLAGAEDLILAQEGYPILKKCFLLVGKGNPRAAAFYEGQGYRRVSTLDNLFSTGDTEDLMLKDLGWEGA